MAEEATRVGRLIVGDTSMNLRRVFGLTERLKGYGKDSDFRARRVHVIGAGVMGGDIAAWCVLQGMEVTLQDREQRFIDPALARAKTLFEKRLKGRKQVPDPEGFMAKPIDQDALLKMIADLLG